MRMDTSRQPEESPAESRSWGLGLRKILVPVDYMEATVKVLQFARELASEHKASVTLLHVVESQPGRLKRLFSGEQLFNGLDAAAEVHLCKLLQVIWGDEISYDIVIATGNPARQIVEEAGKMHSDLIIIGGHGVSGSGGLLRCTTVDRVVRDAPCPVLVVRAFSGGSLPEDVTKNVCDRLDVIP